MEKQDKSEKMEEGRPLPHGAAPWSGLSTTQLRAADTSEFVKGEPCLVCFSDAMEHVICTLEDCTVKLITKNDDDSTFWILRKKSPYVAQASHKSILTLLSIEITGVSQHIQLVATF